MNELLSIVFFSAVRLHEIAVKNSIADVMPAAVVVSRIGHIVDASKQNTLGDGFTSTETELGRQKQ